MSIVIVSDIHLGYEKSAHAVFENFVNMLYDRDDVTDLVILGDFIDMWRRDISGIFLEFNGIIEKIVKLKGKIKVHCIAGNHDYHLLNLLSNEMLGRNYPLKFCTDLELVKNGITYRFMHGHEFDDMQTVPLMEMLCYTMSDDVGELRSEFWNRLTSVTADVEFLKNFFTLHKHDKDSSMIQKLESLGHFTFANVGNLMKSPSDRDWSVDKVESKARDKRDDEFSDRTLIFGHTHKPFVDPESKIANSGSWVTTEESHNTYIEIKEDGIHLMQVATGQKDLPPITCINDVTSALTRKVGTA